jgi:hypothetical protein
MLTAAPNDLCVTANRRITSPVACSAFGPFGLSSACLAEFIARPNLMQRVSLNYEIAAESNRHIHRFSGNFRMISGDT